MEVAKVPAAVQPVVPELGNALHLTDNCSAERRWITADEKVERKKRRTELR